jgi:2-C-methyl-D-erythritol 2,4-cyclodiphosphate synthase
MQIRVGNGFDIHKFEDAPSGRVLVLGGVSFPGERALVGHSDADVIAHAIADALLGAAGLGDIGMHYPDTDPNWKGADSLQLLADVVTKVQGAGWEVSNVDCSVVCEAPKIAPHRDAMIAALSQIVGAPVSVKGRRSEQLGAIGRGEGIMCFASALLTQQ